MTMKRKLKLIKRKNGAADNVGWDNKMMKEETSSRMEIRMRIASRGCKRDWNFGISAVVERDSISSNIISSGSQ